MSGLASRPRIAAVRRWLRSDPNVAGQAYLLTCFFTVRLGEEHRLQELLDGLPQAEESPLAALDQLHFSRLHILRKLVYQGHPQPPDPLRNAYLIFTSSLDGDRDVFLEALRTRVGVAADAIFGHCVDYPGSSDRAAFLDFFHRGQVDNGYALSAYEDASVGEVREALALREQVADFAARARRMDATTLQQQFQETFRKGMPA